LDNLLADSIVTKAARLPARLQGYKATRLQGYKEPLCPQIVVCHSSLISISSSQKYRNSQNTTMASPKKAPSSTKKKSPRDMSIDKLTREINKLNNLLQDKLKIEHDAKEEEYKLLLKKMVGRRIRITLEGDPLYGQEAVITGPRGDSKKPMYWWFELKLTGEKRYKARTSFELLPRQN